MSDETQVPTLAALRQNLLEVRNHTAFNIGSPEAIDHLLITIVAVIDALEAHHGLTIPKPRDD